jgi:hypothetical protein
MTTRNKTLSFNLRFLSELILIVFIPPKDLNNNLKEIKMDFCFEENRV